MTSVSSSNNGPKKMPKSKTPYSSVPPPPVKKKNLTKVINPNTILHQVYLVILLI